jgi:MoxR-like ATPase
MPNWHIYTGDRGPHDGIARRLPDPPPWRDFRGGPVLSAPAAPPGSAHEAQSYRPSAEAVEQVNAALYLRRPLLVTGPPGVGKSSLARAVAHELQLGPVLHWPITSRVTLRDGLYQYDPLTRLYATSRPRPVSTGDAAADGPAGNVQAAENDEDIGSYIRLGPLGTALLPYEQPRVLLIDEIDKSDIDLANDLLTSFEEGKYEILELARQKNPEAEVMTADGGGRVRITGTVQCRAFPLVIMTSNGERQFPPAFLRRCVPLELTQPDTEDLGTIVRAHLGGELAAQSNDLLEQFFDRRSRGALATDQLLNAVYLVHHASISGSADRLALAGKVMPYLSELDAGVDFGDTADDA